MEFDGFTYRKQSPHQLVEPTKSEKCVACHVYATPFVSEEEPAATGHTFFPRIEACGQSGCHEGGFSVVGPRGEFDFKRRQTFTDSLTTVLRGILASATSADSLTQTFAEAKFNLEFVENSGSHGVHNSWYAEDVLKATIAVAEEAFVLRTAVEPVPDAEVPRVFSLAQNYPNPFNPATTIGFDVPVASPVRLTVYNALGQVVATLVNERLSPGHYQVDFNAVNLSSGTYFYTIKAGDVFLRKKMVLVK